MENFIQKIFEIDDEAEIYQKTFENEKNNLLKYKQERLQEIDNHYIKALEDEKSKIQSKLMDIQKQDVKKLDEYKNKSDEIKRNFLEKKSILSHNFAKAILEGEI